MEVVLGPNGFFEALQELPLELDDLLDVTEEGANLRVGKQRFFLHGLQVVL